MQDTERDPVPEDDSIPEDDAIMAELRQIRAQMVAKVGNDPGAIMDYADRQWRDIVKDRLVQPPRREDLPKPTDRSES